MTALSGEQSSSSAIRAARLTAFVAIIAATGGLLFGYDTGIIASALLRLTEEFHLTTETSEIVTSAIIAGALVGALTAAPVSDRIGRRLAILGAALMFLAGTIAITLADSVTWLILSRLELGLAIGAASQIVPVYIAEIAPPERRGSLVVAFQLAVVSGMLISYITGFILRDYSWRLLFGLGVIPALILFFGMLFLPNSPRWMAMQGQVENARRVLNRLRMSRDHAEEELQEILSSQKAMEEGGQRGVAELFAPWVRPALIASVGVALFCQITGINAVLYYAPTIFSGAGFSKDVSLLTSIAIGIAMVITTLLGGWAVDAWGRRRLMLCFLPGAVIGLMMTALMFSLGLATQGVGAWVTIISLVAYTFFNVGSLSVTIWLIGAEVFPLACRSQGMSLVSATHWVADLVVSLTTLSLVSLLGPSGIFWLFAAMNLLAFLFVWRYVPETRGVSLEEIERRLRQGTFLTSGSANRR